MSALLPNQKAVLYTMAVLIVAGVAVVFITRPTQPAFWIGAVVLGFGAIATIASIMLAKQKGKILFGNRATLSDEEICRQFADAGFPEPLVIELCREVADAVHLPAGKLRAGDRFGHELGGYWITSDDLDTLGQVATARARRRGVTLNLEEIKTLDEYVRRLAAIESST